MSSDVAEDSSGPGILDLAGARYWTASVLPAIVGTVLPFWIRPIRYSFKWIGALEFLVATVLVHAGFSLLLAVSDGRRTEAWSRTKLAWTSAACLAAACLLGLRLGRFTSDTLLFTYGFAVFFAGLLYVSPPFSFHLRPGREIVIAKGLGFIPVLGAYLIQVGDIKRVVYIAATPIVAATWLWIWTEEMSTRASDIDAGRQSLVTAFGSRFSGRVVLPMIAAGLVVTIVGAVATGSVSALALVALPVVALLARILAISWIDYGDPARMRVAVAGARGVHLVVCVALAVSTLGALLR